MTRRTRITMMVLWLALPAGAWAQEPLSLQQAVEETLANNPSLAAARAAAEAETAGVAAARGAWYPRLSLTESWQRGNQPVFVFSSLLASRRFTAENFAIAALNQPDPTAYFHATAGLEQLVYDGGARSAAVAGARARERIADLGTREAAQALARSATEIYGRLLTAQAARQAAAAALEAGREDHARAVRRRDAGVATEADVLALAVHVADMEQRVIQADGDAAVLRAQLNRLMGTPVNRAFLAVEPAPEAGSTSQPIEALLAEARAARADIARAEAEQALADASRRAAQSVFLPKVAAQAAFDVSGLRLSERASNWIVGGEVRWTFSLAGTERAQLKAATAARTRARADAEDTRARVDVEVISAFQRLQAARARQAVGRAATAQARESQRIIRDRYDAGLAPVNDLLRAATVVLDAEAQRVAALVDELTSAAELRRSVGRQP